MAGSPQTSAGKPELPPSEKAGKRLGRKARRLIAVLVAAAVLLLGAWLCRLFLSPPAPAPAAQDSQTVGTIDLKKLTEAHEDYAALQQKLRQRETLQAKLDALLRPPFSENPLQAEPPALDDKPFADSVWQKNAQDVIGGRSEMERQIKKAAAAYESETRGDYQAKRDEINAEYLNSIFNLKLKLQNAEQMGLKKEEVEAIQQQLEEIEQERGDRQHELYLSWRQEIADYVKQRTAEQAERLKASIPAKKEQRESEAIQNEAAAQERNAAAISEQIATLQQKQLQAKQVQDELDALEQDISQTENHILSDIASFAAREAIRQHLTMVVASPATDLRALYPRGLQPHLTDRYVRVISVNTVDLTDDVLEAIQPEDADDPASSDDADSQSQK
jgi:hypothetical protein